MRERERPPDVFYERFGALLEQAQERGVTVVEIARATGIDRSRLYRWKDRVDGPSGSSLAGIADYFGVTMDYLWGRSDEPGTRFATGPPSGGGPEEGPKRSSERASAALEDLGEAARREREARPRRRRGQGEEDPAP
jgi:transcriptional regulator with XRE-family HTH domain